MRVLGLIVCGVLLSACTSQVDEPPKPDALTAEEVLGDYRTIDYCTLLDAEAGTPVSSFEACRLDAGGIRRMVGPVKSDDDIGLAREETRHYDYPGDLPRGVAVRQPVRDYDGACLLWLGFADHVWLSVSSSDTAPDPAPGEEPCAVTEDLVAGVLAAIEDERVEHVSYEEDSYGSLDPCAVLNTPRVGAVVGTSSAMSPFPHGHECLFGHVGLAFSVDVPDQRAPETVAGRPAVVDATGGFCVLTVDRPLPDRPGLVERAKLTGVSLTGDGAAACPDVRAVAELVIPELPR